MRNTPLAVDVSKLVPVLPAYPTFWPAGQQGAAALAQATVTLTDPVTVTADVQGKTSGVRTFLNGGHLCVLKQTGTVTGLWIRYNKGVSRLSTITARLYRRNAGGTLDRVGNDTEDFHAQLTNDSFDEVKTNVTFGTPLTGGRIGDLLAIVTTCPGAGGINLAYTSGLAAEDYRGYYIDGDPGTTAVAFPTGWVSDPQFVWHFGAIMAVAPLGVIAGDSIAAGVPQCQDLYSAFSTSGGKTWLVDEWPTVEQTIAGSLEGLDATTFKVANVGEGSTTSTDWASSLLASRVVAKTPRWCALFVGLNDIATGISQATFITNLQTMWTALRTASILPIAATITPFQGGTDAQKASVAAYNNALLVAASAAGVPVIPANARVADGTDPNIILAAYRSATTPHLTAAGYLAVARAALGY